MFTLTNHPTQAEPFPDARLVERRLRIDCWELPRSCGLVPGSKTVVSANGVQVASLSALSNERRRLEVCGGQRCLLTGNPVGYPDPIRGAQKNTRIFSSLSSFIPWRRL